MALVQAPENVARHAFWPLIVDPVTVISRKAVAGQRRWSRKLRPIAIAAHADSHIYTHYAHLLRRQLEDCYAREAELSRAVLAYRRFVPARCNVHFALEAFTEIEQGGAHDVLALDIRSFFDCIDHRRLKQAWQRLLATDSLSADHYAIYKAVTQAHAITVGQLRDLFGGEIRRRTGKDQAAVCSPADFRRKVVPQLVPLPTLVDRLTGSATPCGVGIPQGIAISTVLANLYLLETDREILAALKALGGSYRRYSDDILIVVPAGLGSRAEELVKAAIDRVGLQINERKTRRYRFVPAEDAVAPATSLAVDEQWQPVAATPISYLGLSFDGRQVRIRDSTIAGFMEKAGNAIERAFLSAKKRGEGKIKKRLLYARLTRLGYGRAYTPDADGVLPKAAPRLGFFKYLALAGRVTRSAAIARQAAQLENRVHRMIAHWEGRLPKRTG